MKKYQQHGQGIKQANLGGAVLTNANLSTANLTGVKSGYITGTPTALPAEWKLINGHLVGPGADLQYADLYNANLSNSDLFLAKLTGVKSGSITGTPAALPDGWKLINGYLVGPRADLTDANLSGTNLSGANLANVVWGNTTCPDSINSDLHLYVVA